MLARAVEDALAARGTVMLQTRGGWCAICASVQGDLEARVGEPRRGWRRWTPSAGERWLADNGFTHRVDAWVRPVASARECVALLEAALEHALGVPAGTQLRRTLVQRGVPKGVAAPAPEAKIADHLAAALTALRRGEARALHTECGLPARPLAWAWVDGGALVVEVGPAPDAIVEIGRFDSPHEAAQRLAEELPAEPLFIGLIDD